MFRMIIAEIKGRFAGSVGGFLWNFVHPILMLAVYLFVFVYVFKLRVNTGGSAGASAVYIMAGLFPWMVISEGLMRGTSSMIDNSNLILKTPFPTEILLGKSVLAPLCSYGVAILLLAIYAIAATGSVSLVLALPLLLVLQILFTTGVTFLTSTLSVFFRDVLQFVQILVTFWIYLTPILYPVNMLPDWVRVIMYANPLYPLISLYQSLFIKGVLGQWPMVWLALAWSLFFFGVGSFIFNKLKYEFADWL
jgi:homopolymeric O-antigen transport system permease protein